MERSLRNELDSCISELRSIVRQLNGVSADIKDSISGMNTNKFTNSLEKSAGKYKKAADKLSKIK